MDVWVGGGGAVPVFQPKFSIVLKNCDALCKHQHVKSDTLIHVFYMFVLSQWAKKRRSVRI